MLGYQESQEKACCRLVGCDQAKRLLKPPSCQVKTGDHGTKDRSTENQPTENHPGPQLLSPSVFDS